MESRVAYNSVIIMFCDFSYKMTVIDENGETTEYTPEQISQQGSNEVEFSPVVKLTTIVLEILEEQEESVVDIMIEIFACSEGKQMVL